MKAVLALAVKDLRLLVRDKGTMFWVLVFPLLIGVLFGFVFGGDNAMAPIELAIVDQDQSADSKALVAELQKSTALSIRSSSLDNARDDVRKGRRAAYVLIPKGYGDYGPFEPAPDKNALTISADPSRKIESGMLEGIIRGAMFQAMSRGTSGSNGSVRTWLKLALSSRELDPSTAEFLQSVSKYMGTNSSHKRLEFSGPKVHSEAVHQEGTKPGSSFEVTFPQALVWGILGVVSTFAISLVKERRQGTLLRLRVSPMSFTKILGGKGLACFLAVEGVMLGLLLIGHFLFHVRIGAVGILAMSMFSTGIAFVGIMMLLSTLGKTEQAVSGSAWGIMMLMAMFGGGMIPIAMMPGWMRAASDFSPLKWTTLTVEGAIWRGFGLSEMLLPCGILIAVGLVAFSLGVRMMPRAAE